MRTSMRARLKRAGAGALLLSLLLPLLLPSVLAVGASPASLSFDSLLPGGYAEASILLSNPREEPSTLSLSLIGEAAPWMNVTPSDLTIPARGSFRALVSVSPPPDAEPRAYAATLRILFSPTPAGGGAATSALALTLSVPLSLSVQSDASPACLLGGLSLPDYEQGSPLFLRYTISNVGNTRIAPRGELVVESAAGSPIATQEVHGQAETLPTTVGEYSFSGTSGLGEGDYAATLRIEGCGSPRETAFSVLPPGSLSDAGSFVALDAGNATGALPGEIVPVAASFRNGGERPVSVRFSGVVEREGKVIRVIESEPLLAAPGESVSLGSFFSPDGPGRYTVRGSLVYGSRRTEERSVTVVVETTEGGAGGDVTVAVATLLLLLVLLSVVLLVLIQRKRR